MVMRRSARDKSQLKAFTASPGRQTKWRMAAQVLPDSPAGPLNGAIENLVRFPGPLSLELNQATYRDFKDEDTSL